MNAPSDDNREFERFRSYLRFLVRVQFCRPLRGKIDPSYLVQQSLLQAYQERDQFRGSTEAERAGWLRQILTRNLLHFVRDFQRERRDVNRERSLEQAVEESSVRLQDWLVADQSSPSQSVERRERALLVASAMEQLAEDQQEAVLLRYWHGWPLAEIAGQMGRTTGSVAGLLQRGLKTLRGHLEHLGVDHE